MTGFAPPLPLPRAKHPAGGDDLIKSDSVRDGGSTSSAKPKRKRPKKPSGDNTPMGEATQQRHQKHPQGDPQPSAAKGKGEEPEKQGPGKGRGRRSSRSGSRTRRDGSVSQPLEKDAVAKEGSQRAQGKSVAPNSPVGAAPSVPSTPMQQVAGTVPATPASTMFTPFTPGTGFTSRSAMQTPGLSVKYAPDGGTCRVQMGRKQFYFYGKKNSTGRFLRIVEKSKSGSTGKLIIEEELMEPFSAMLGKFLEPCIELGSRSTLPHPRGKNKEGRDYVFAIIDHPEQGPCLEVSQMMGLKQAILVPHHGLAKFQGALDHMIIATQGLTTPMATPRYMASLASSQTPAATPRLVSQTPAHGGTGTPAATPRATPVGPKQSKKKKIKKPLGSSESQPPAPVPTPKPRSGEEPKPSAVATEIDEAIVSRESATISKGKSRKNKRNKERAGTAQMESSRVATAADEQRTVAAARARELEACAHSCVSRPVPSFNPALGSMKAKSIALQRALDEASMALDETGSSDQIEDPPPPQPEVASHSRAQEETAAVVGPSGAVDPSPVPRGHPISISIPKLILPTPVAIPYVPETLPSGAESPRSTTSTNISFNLSEKVARILKLGSPAMTPNLSGANTPFTGGTTPRRGSYYSEIEQDDDAIQRARDAAARVIAAVEKDKVSSRGPLPPGPQTPSVSGGPQAYLVEHVTMTAEQSQPPLAAPHPTPHPVRPAAPKDASPSTEPASSDVSELSSLPQPSLSPDDGTKLVSKTHEFNLVSSLLTTAPSSYAPPPGKQRQLEVDCGADEVKPSAKLSEANLLLLDARNSLVGRPAD